ncbi:GNAT family N-acetyltransferase [soil metagenome]
MVTRTALPVGPVRPCRVIAEATASRPALAAEIPYLENLIAASARALGRGFYSEAETEAAITHVFGVDTELVADRTYLVATIGDAIAGCGGWSRRRTLFGGDRYAKRESGLLDPATEPARIRAFFVHPDHARKRVGSAILHACEDAARDAGFTATTLMATLPGVPFYTAHGYQAGEEATLDLDGVPVKFVNMRRELLHNSDIF